MKITTLLLVIIPIYTNFQTLSVAPPLFEINIDLLPSNSILKDIELVLAPLIGRETILRQYINIVKPLYDVILIDTAPASDALNTNALAAVDSVIIPVVPKFLDAKGFELLLKSVAQIRRQINPSLEIERYFTVYSL